MNWEETIIHIRKIDEYKQLVRDTYLDADLNLNITHFIKSEEFLETLELINKYTKGESKKLKILDIGAGNGISSVAFALNHYQTYAVEPDVSDTVGCGAIKILKERFQLHNLNIYSSFGEALPFEGNYFDIVYARQAMHHAQNLSQFVNEAARVLKKGGLLITCRDHVVNDENQKAEFLLNHPLQKYYGGENAFSLNEYTEAFSKAGLTMLNCLGPLDNVINYSPKSEKEMIDEFKNIIKNKTGFKFPNIPFLNQLILQLFKWKTNNLFSNAGRLFTFVLTKPNI